MMARLQSDTMPGDSFNDPEMLGGHFPEDSLEYERSDTQDMPEESAPERPARKQCTVRFCDLADPEDNELHQGRSPSPRKSQSHYSARSPQKTQSRISARSEKTSFWSRLSDDDEEEDEEGLEKTPWCCCKRGSCSGSGCCHFCYILAFLCFLVIFPLFLKWMLMAPKPPEYWHQKFPKFPLLADWRFVRDGVGASYGLQMSKIPTFASGCNHSCATQRGSLRASAEMNFDVTLKFDAPQFQHTAYPVLLASNDFSEWWVAADRRHAYPTQYFPGHNTQSGEEYHYYTAECSRPPDMFPGITNGLSPRRLQARGSTASISSTSVAPTTTTSELTTSKSTTISSSAATTSGTSITSITSASAAPITTTSEITTSKSTAISTSAAVTSVTSITSISSTSMSPTTTTSESTTSRLTTTVDTTTTVVPNLTVRDAMTPSQFRLERPSEVPGYVVACITWTSSKVAMHRRQKEFVKQDLPKFCDAIGGVCGWPCQNSATQTQLPGCSAHGAVLVDNALGKVASVSIPGAQFSGSVSIRACLPGSAECVASPRPFSQWDCHKCHNASDSQILHYDSLPRMEVVLNGVSVDTTQQGTMAPQAYILTTPVSDDGFGADGLRSGVWKKLYDYDIFPLPVPVDKAPAPVPRSLSAQVPPVPPATQPTVPPPVLVDESWHIMRHRETNSITVKPDWCFGKRGALYLVACAVNTSTHLDKFAFKPGQKIAPPPFNDRCLAVTGRCAYACTEQQQPLLHCDSVSDEIPQDDLVNKAATKDNQVLPVYLFVWTLLIGFAVRILSYFPGLFVPYRRAKHYIPQMTDQLKYIAVVTPSGGETKACVLRNLVGAMSTLPKDCQCYFHVLYADEGHRHSHKIMFRAFVAVMAYVPQVCMDVSRKSKRLKTGYKEKNLKAFTECWVESTKKLKLKECNTADIVKTIEKLKEDLPGNAEKIKKLEGIIDALSGATALQMLQEKAGWPKVDEGPHLDGSLESMVRDLEHAIHQMRLEIMCGEQEYDGTNTSEGRDRDARVPLHLDDHVDYGWTDPTVSTAFPVPLYNLHYVARAKPPEDERKLKVQHIAQGIWYYTIPKEEEALDRKTWLEWRQNVQEFTPGEMNLYRPKYLVPVRTSRGKAGGLNFAENYLFDFHVRFETPRAVMDPVRFKHALFSIADARHQYQPDFFIETIPYFYKSSEELNTRVAFTQCPQYFQEMPDESDYLDTNNTNFFRLSCMLRNCCGGVSSCGTNGTWLVRDRRAGRSETNTMWEMEHGQEMEQGFSQVVERRFFHESCKVEDTASSLDRVVRGKFSQYINLRLSYGMAKAPTDYLAAIQRWAEGGVVLAWQTFLGTEEGVYMIWMTFILFMGFIVSVFFVIHGPSRPVILTRLFRLVMGDDRIMEGLERLTHGWAVDAVSLLNQQNSSLETFQDMFLSVVTWLLSLVLCVMVISLLTSMSYIAHHTTCWGRFNPARRTRFPICLAQWARLAITVDNLTYFLWFWTAFFWIGFNYYGVFVVKQFHFEPTGMTAFSWTVTVLVWSLILSASARNTKQESGASNEIFVLSLTNIWRTTQLFYITAPLTLYSIVMGTLDFSRHQMFGEDISYWVGGDRGAVSKSIVQWWTLLLLGGTAFTWGAFFAGWLPGGGGNVASVLIVTCIGLDVLHPCAFLWLGNVQEALPPAEVIHATGLSGKFQKCCKRTCQLLFSSAFWKNCARSFIFSPRSTGCIKWIAPLQHAILPVLTLFFPFLGINNVLLLLAATR